jgi:hypothetical protein
MGIKKGPLRPLFFCSKTRMINCGQGCRTACQFVRKVLARYTDHSWMLVGTFGCPASGADK